METIQIKTPMNVNVEVQHAGVGRRFFAFLIDQVVIVLYIISIVYFFVNVLKQDFSTIIGDEDGNLFDRLQFLEIIFTLLMVPAFFYSLLTETLLNGQTVGKLIMGIRVVKLDGYKAGFSEYFTRWAFRFVDFWTGSFLLLFFIPLFGEKIAIALATLLMAAPGLLAFLLIVRTKNGQRLGDLIAGTTVLKLKEQHSINITILEDIQESYQPSYPQVIKLSDNDARIIKDTYLIAKKGRDRKTMKRLRTKLEEVMEVQSDQTDMEFIDTVMKDFNYYTQKL